MLADPLITVVIPTHNRPVETLRAVRSVLGQGETDFSLIVVDDGSTDDTVQVLGAVNDPRLRVKPRPHLGVSAARNHGVASSQSEYVTFLDSDDVALEGWLKAFVTSARSGVDLFSCGVEYLSEGTGAAEMVAPANCGPAFDDVCALFQAGAYMVRRSTFTSAGGFPEGLRFGENSDLGMRIGALIASDDLMAASIPDPLVRIHRSDRVYDAEERFDSATRLLCASYDFISKDPSLLASHYAITGVAASRLGHRRQALSNLALAVRHHPTEWRHWGRLARAAAPRAPRRSRGTDD
ncbi:MAG: glycosyltransferase family A protein [Ilumatobacter sp.]